MLGKKHACAAFMHVQNAVILASVRLVVFDPTFGQSYAARMDAQSVTHLFDHN